jgi:hypothetical protein
VHLFKAGRKFEWSLENTLADRLNSTGVMPYSEKTRRTAGWSDLITEETAMKEQ